MEVYCINTYPQSIHILQFSKEVSCVDLLCVYSNILRMMNLAGEKREVLFGMPTLVSSVGVEGREFMCDE